MLVSMSGQTVSRNDLKKQLDQLYGEYWEFVLKEDPLTATYLGDHRYDHELGDGSAEAFQRRIQSYGKFLDRLRKLGKPAAKADLLNYELFERELEDLIESAKFQPYMTPMTQQTGLQIDIPELVTYHPFDS